jgi:hypothetical protein
MSDGEMGRYNPAKGDRLRKRLQQTDARVGYHDDVPGVRQTPMEHEELKRSDMRYAGLKSEKEQNLFVAKKQVDDTRHFLERAKWEVGNWGGNSEAVPDLGQKEGVAIMTLKTGERQRQLGELKSEAREEVFGAEMEVVGADLSALVNTEGGRSEARQLEDFTKMVLRRCNGWRGLIGRGKGNFQEVLHEAVWGRLAAALTGRDNGLSLRKGPWEAICRETFGSDANPKDVAGCLEFDLRRLYFARRCAEEQGHLDDGKGRIPTTEVMMGGLDYGVNELRDPDSDSPIPVLAGDRTMWEGFWKGWNGRV